MEFLRSPITWLLLALAVTMGGWGWSARSAAKAEGQVTTLKSDLKAADDKAKEAALRERTKDSAIDTLTEQLMAQATAAQQLQGQLDQLATSATAREQTIVRLKRENAELKSWADGRLPIAVVGLLQRPAATGAADYQAHLSATGSMPTARRDTGQ